MPVPRCATTAEHTDFELELVRGTWPEGIGGEILFSAPARSGRLPYVLFDWGVICRLTLQPGARGAAPGRFAWQARMIRTPGRRLAERHPEAFRPGPVGYHSPFGPPNAANTAPLPWGDRLYATWDAGRPVELDPDTLEFVAEVGHVDAWGGSSMDGMGGVMPFVFSSAHPVVDPERDCLWSVKLVFDLAGGGLRPHVVRWDGTGTTLQRWPLTVCFAGSLHTISQTRDWLILADSGNFKADPGEVMGGERTVTIDDEVPIWLLRKDVIEATPPGEPLEPTSFTFGPPAGHYYARWDDTDGISVVWEGMDLMDLGFSLRPDDRDLNGNPVDPGVVGLYNMAMGPETILEIELDPVRGKVLERGAYRQDWLVNKQLSAMDWSTEGLSRPRLHHLAVQGAKPGSISERAAALYAERLDRRLVERETPGALVSFERESMRLHARFDYPDLGDLVTSPTFVPRNPGAVPGHSRHAPAEPGGADGWVVLPVLSDAGVRVDVFDAADVGRGPVATLAGTKRECVPLLLHSAWMPTPSGARADAERLRFADELDDERLSALPDELAASVRAVAAELDAEAR
jgi:hypothetical protein